MSTPYERALERLQSTIAEENIEVGRTDGCVCEADAALLIEYNEQYFSKMIREGQLSIPYRLKGNKKRFEVEELAEYLALRR